MSKSRVRKIICGLALALCAMVGLGAGGDAYATTLPNNTIADKAIFQGLWSCYSNDYVKKEIAQLSEYSGMTQPLEYLTKGGVSDSADNYVPLVTGYEWRKFKVTNDNGLSCHEMINKRNGGFIWSTPGLMSAFNKTAPKKNNAEGVIELTQNMGYVVNSSNDVCYALTYNGGSKTNQVCQKGDGSLYHDSYSGAPNFRVQDNNRVCLYLPSNTSGGSQKGCWDLADSNFDGAWLMRLVTDVCGSATCSYRYGNQHDGTATSGEIKFDTSVGGPTSSSSLSNSSAKFRSNSGGSAAFVAIRFLSGNNDYKSIASIRLNDGEKRILYQAYLQSYYEVEINCAEGQMDEAFDGKINWYEDGAVKECHYETNKAKNKDKKVNGVDDQGWFQYQNLDMQGVIDALNAMPRSVSDDLAAAAQSSDSLKDLCYDAGVDDQGWFLCPSLENMTYTANGFDQLIQEWLSIDPELYNDQSPTYAVWGIMRNIANVLMIILLLAVIFSQLTGFGIDNYGIKKMLPRLITMAVLINLSFLICELAVDLSNVLGVGLRDMFGAVGNGLQQNQSFDGADFVAGAVTTLLVSTVGAGAVGGTVVAVAGVMASGPLVVVIILLALLSVIAALLLFFVAIGARMIMVILCIAVAPVAFALFILPNTQAVFKKWLNIFKVALIMFPICGALGGISNLIKGMVGNSTNVWMLVVGIISPFLVFFLLPMLLKGSIAALGQIGNAMMNMGQSLTGGAKNFGAAVQNSDRFQYAKDSAMADQARKVRDRLSQRMANGETLNGRQMAQFRRANRRVTEWDTGQRKAYTDMYMDMGQDELFNLAGGQRNADGTVQRDANGNEVFKSLSWLNQPDGEQRMSALIGAMEARGMEGSVYSLLRANDVRDKTRVMNSLAASDNTVLKAFGKRGAGSAGFDDFMTGTGANSMQGYAESKKDDFAKGLDDKSLAEIAKSEAASGTQIMSTAQLVQSAAQLNDGDSLDEVNKMLRSRNDIKINGEQLAKFNASTIDELMSTQKGLDAIMDASGDLARNTELVNKLDPTAKNKINAKRASLYSSTGDQKYYLQL